MRIEKVSGYQILDSRGMPTVEAEVVLESGVRGHGIAPAGASIGRYEAIELRDGNPKRFRGKSVEQAIAHIEGEIAQHLIGRSVLDQSAIDLALINLDGTPDKRRLGANAILSVSMAVAYAAAQVHHQPLYEYLGKGKGTLLPIPQTQIIGGGAHAGRRMDLQDITVLPIAARSYREAMEVCFNIYQCAGDLLASRNQRFGVADEGGYWPDFSSNAEALAFTVEAIQAAGYQPGREAALSLDIAASDLFDRETQRYQLRLEQLEYTTAEFAELLVGWCREFPIVSVEDPMADTDLPGWETIAASIGNSVQLIGDDFFTTNLKRIRNGIDQRLANAVLIKPNQIGTVTETLDAIHLTQSAGWRAVVSARSGETEDVFISHLAVGTNAGQLKLGAFARSERTAKWNELIRIERDLGLRAHYEGFSLFV